jgi:WD40 repeat protein
MAELQSTDITTKKSPSLLYNNLTAAGRKVAYIHQTDVHILDTSSSTCTTLGVKGASQVASYGGDKLLTITKDEAVTFGSDEKQLGVAKLATPDSLGTRGIGVINDIAFVGHSNGSISVVSLKDNKTISTLQQHADGITAITCGEVGEPVVVSADMSGDIIVWSVDGKVKAKIARAEGETPTSIAVGAGHIIVSYGSGKIRFFDGSGKKRIEVSAHARWINAISFNSATNTLASVSEDQLLQLWSVTDKVAHKGYKWFPNALLTGVAFADDGKVYVSAYDVEKIFAVSVM